MRAPVALLAYPAGDRRPATDSATGRARARSGRSPSSRRSGRRCAGRRPARCRCASSTCRRPCSWPWATRPRPTGERASGCAPTRSARWPRRPATTTPERWWEDVVEHRLDQPRRRRRAGRGALAPFAAIAEAMAEVRAHAAGAGRGRALEEERREARDAHARCGRRCKRVRAGRGGVRGLARAGADRRRCPRPPPTPGCCAACRRPRSAMTWVPWTHARLASGQGYGAGVRSPGLVPPPVHHPVGDRAAVAGQGRGGAAPRRRCRSPAPTSSRRPGSPTRWPPCAAGRCPA